MIDNDQDRISKKAHELWEAEGRPHGRDQDHWDQAKEIIALQDSAGDALLPRDTGAEEPVEERSIAIDNEGEAPNLTDTGEHDLTSTAREPTFQPMTKPSAPAKPKAAAKKASSRSDASKSEVAKTAKPKSSAKAATKAK
jgi:hypothetical protein